MTTNFLTPLFVAVFGSGMGKNPGSGINIPDPQHWCVQVNLNTLFKENIFNSSSKVIFLFVFPFWRRINSRVQVGNISRYTDGKSDPGAAGRSNRPDTAGFLLIYAVDNCTYKREGRARPGAASQKKYKQEDKIMSSLLLLPSCLSIFTVEKNNVFQAFCRDVAVLRMGKLSILAGLCSVYPSFPSSEG